MKYAKITCGALQVPENYPGYIVIDGVRIFHPTEEQYRSAGYLPLFESTPEEIEGKIAIATYKMDRKKTKITQVWVYVDEDEMMGIE